MSQRVFRCVFLAVLASMWFAGTASADIATIEGHSFSGPVAGFPQTCSFTDATIDWGDGGTSTGGVTQNALAFKGTHTYGEEGSYNATVNYRCAQFRGVQTVPFHAAVADAPLTSFGSDSSGSPGQSLSAVVGHIDDSNPAAVAGEYSAQIVWGDGSSDPGLAVAAAGGGFDVTGTHTYGTAGSYSVTTSVADIGGSTTTSAAVISVGVPPPPPPPLTGPEAQFAFAPHSPCRNDYVSFDASASIGSSIPPLRGRLPVTEYRWAIDDSAFATPPVLSAGPTFAHVFTESSYSIGPYGGPLDNSLGDLFDYHFFRPPADVTLEVTDSAGRTATVRRTITFRNPEELLVGVVKIDRLTGLPDFTHVHFLRDIRSRDVKLCDSRSSLQKLGAEAFKVGQATFKAASAVLGSSGAGAAYRAFINVKTRCPSKRIECFGQLIVRGGPGAPGETLGHATLFEHAGRTATATVNLNARGRAAARAHGLRTVILQLRSLNTRGKLVTTSRIVQLRSRRLAPAMTGSASAVSAAAMHVVRVLDDHSHVVATFRSAKCHTNKLGFFSETSNRGYVLEANVIPFRGFDKTYELKRGHYDPQVVKLVSPSGVHYASDFVPPYPVPGAGAINFADHGKLMGVGFSPMFSQDGSDAVTVAGVLKCKYPRKKPRH